MGSLLCYLLRRQKELLSSVCRGRPPDLCRISLDLLEPADSRCFYYQRSRPVQLWTYLFHRCHHLTLHIEVASEVTVHESGKL